MTLPLTAIIVATLAQYVFSAVWYMPLFGNLWGKIHGFDQVPKEKQAEMTKHMWKPLLVQLILTIITTVVFALLKNGLPPTWSIYGLAFFFWLGFIVPTQIGAVLFGGTEPRWVIIKSLIMAGAGLGSMMVLAVVFAWLG